MTWEKKITLGNVLELTALLIAAILFVTTMKSDVQAINQKHEQMSRDMVRIEERQKDFVTKEVYLELQIQLQDIKKSLENLNNKIDRNNR